MEKSKIDRINFLARKSKEEPLSVTELAEQADLRREYLAEFRASFSAQLENTVIERPDGSREKLPKKDKRES